MSSKQPRLPQITPFTFLRTDEGQSWLEKAEVAEPIETPCCARCRRGTKAHGHRPCGYAGLRTGCPNRDCVHHRRT